jgi:glycosyltransferase involved in cell wall biosynthesis
VTEDLTVAFDATPLVGVRTGIGMAVAETFSALQQVGDAPHLVPYALSLRARRHRDMLPETTRFVPYPARFLLRRWAGHDAPTIDRWVRPARVLHATNYLAPPSAMPTLVSVYDCSFVRYPELCTPEVRAFAPIVRRAIARGATIHTTSQFVAAEIEELFGPGLSAGDQIVVVPLGVPPLGDASAMPPAAAALAGAPYVLAIGTLEPRKNLPHLVSAFGAIASSRPELHLVLAGPDGPARPEVERALERLPEPIRSRTLLTGPVTDAGRRALLEHATALAYPSIYEGFGFPVLEAMTVGVPVVAARAGAIPEVADDAAILVDATDESALAGALESLLDDGARRSELVSRGHARVARYSWDSTARGLAACYTRLAGPP